MFLPVGAFAAAIAVAAALGAPALQGETPQDAPLSVPWWFDPDRGTVCWISKEVSFDFIIDLDGVHHTGFSSVYTYLPSVGNYAAPATWDGRGGSTIGDEKGTGASMLSVTVVRPPYPHVRFAVLGEDSEWFHPLVTKRWPPTNWVLGIGDDDGTRALPITRPFWVSTDHAQTWTEHDPASFSGPTGACVEHLEVPWWFDPARGTVCWNGRWPPYASFGFIIDLDGRHDTGMSSVFSRGGPIVGNWTAHSTWDGRGGSTIGDETGTGGSLLSESLVRPPHPHFRFTLFGEDSEWFHPFVTKRTPPTDWVLGIGDDDGTRALPITRPFWVSMDHAQTWTEHDPAAYAGPTGDCIEDVRALEATVDFDPDTLNPRSRGRWVTVYIELPPGHDPGDVDAATVRMNDFLSPVLDPRHGFVRDPAGYLVDHDGDGLAERMVKFDRADVFALLPPGTHRIRITGKLADGTAFSGMSDPVRVLP